MADFARDPFNNAINGGIKDDINFLIDHGRYRAAVPLVLAGTDTMAYLNMPAGRLDVNKHDYVRWADDYICFPCKEQLTGRDLYGARCALLHSYGVVSKLSREGKCRMVGYVDNCWPEVRYDRKVSPALVIVSIVALKDAFFRGVDAFLVDVYADKDKEGRGGAAVAKSCSATAHTLGPGERLR